jgi:hypothetical protein
MRIKIALVRFIQSGLSLSKRPSDDGCYAKRRGLLELRHGWLDQCLGACPEDLSFRGNS